MHKKVTLILFSLLVQLSASNAQQVLSLNPLFTEQDAILVPQVESRWSMGDGDTVVIKKAGDNFYLLQYGKTNIPSEYEARFVSVDNTIFLDLVPKLPDTIGSKDYREQIQSLHSFFKIKIKNDELWVVGLNYGWFYKEFEKNKNFLPHSWVESGLLITAPTDELPGFIKEHINDPAFAGDSFSLVKNQVANMGSMKNASFNFSKDPPLNFHQKCATAFPLKNGWLGGDGDVSVPLNETQSLFIFSDSYVGYKNDSSRQSKDYTMVSNTVGIAGCTREGKYDIQYYWRNMYSANPKPVFISHTDRYRYWINGAFMHKGCLYVFMPKIGPKIGAAPDDIFNFSQIGFSLARVINPLSVTPDQWNPELIPFSFLVSYFDDVHTVVKDGNYLYLYTQRGRNQTELLRLDLDFVDSPKEHIEYYSSSHTWKPGIDTMDMAIIIPEKPGNTINYHDDIKKWVMVCGPGFLDNKIRLRTAGSLTGPWSEALTVYECPEITPGNPFYNKNNFCYLGRELFQNYDKETHTIHLTYDINNSDFSEIRSNPKIYTPRIVTVSLTNHSIR